MSRQTVVIDLNLATGRRCTSQERQLPPTSPPMLREKQKTFPAPASHFHCKADELVAALQRELQVMAAKVQSLTGEKAALEQQLLQLKSSLDDRSPKRESSCTTTSLTTGAESTIAKLVADCKLQEEVLQGTLKDLRKRLENKTLRIRNLEDELRESRRELEAAQRANRSLRIELTACKEALTGTSGSDAEALAAKQKLPLAEGQLVAMEAKLVQREVQLIADIQSLKEKNKRLKEELIQNESMLYVCRIELSARR